MKCDYQKLNEPPQHGREHWKCARHGCNHNKTDVWVPPTSGRIHPGKCNAIPRWWEFGGWVELLIEATGLLDWFPRLPGQEFACGCDKRAVAMDAAGDGLASTLGAMPMLWFPR